MTKFIEYIVYVSTMSPVILFIFESWYKSMELIHEFYIRVWCTGRW